MRSLKRAQTEEPRSLGRPADVRPGRLDVAQREPVEIDPAVDHGALRQRVRHDVDQPVEQPCRHRHDGGGPPDGEGGSRPDRSTPAGVLDVLPVSRDHERCPPAEGGEEPCGYEEVRVDDVRAKPPCGPEHVDPEPGVASAPPGPVDDRPREIVTAGLELALERGDERAQ